MKTALLILCCLCFISPIFSQTAELIPFRSGSKWGFANLDGTIKIEPKYDSVRFFVCDLAVVGIKGKYGYLNEQGEEITKLKYSEAEDFDCRNKFGRVVYKKKRQTVNSLGKRVIIRSFSYEAGCGNYAYPLPPLNPIQMYEQNQKFGFLRFKCPDPRIDSCLIRFPLEYDGYTKFGANNVALKKNGKWGVLNYNRELVLPFEFDNILVDTTYTTDINGPFIIIKDGKYGFINPDGAIIIEPKFDKAIFFEEGLTKVWVNENWGYLNQNGTEYFKE